MMTDLDKTTEDKIQQLQMIEQSLSNLLMQRQQLQSQIVEADSALTELDNTKEAYKIVGNIMVSGDKEKLKEEIKGKKEIVELRIKKIIKQEEDIKEKSKKIQSEVLDKMNEGEKNEQ